METTLLWQFHDHIECSIWMYECCNSALVSWRILKLHHTSASVLYYNARRCDSFYPQCSVLPELTADNFVGWLTLKWSMSICGCPRSVIHVSLWPWALFARLVISAAYKSAIVTGNIYICVVYMLIWTALNGTSSLIDVKLTISGTRGIHFVYNKLLSKGEQHYVLVYVHLDILVWFKHIFYSWQNMTIVRIGQSKKALLVSALHYSHTHPCNGVMCAC